MNSSVFLIKYVHDSSSLINTFVWWWQIQSAIPYPCSLKRRNKMSKLHPHSQIIWQWHTVDPFSKGALTGTDFIWNHLQSRHRFLFSFYAATGPQKSLAWLRVLQHDLLCDSLVRFSKLATRLWSGTWDFRGAAADARRTCCVIAAISQFGNIIEKVSCHAGDQTGEQRADAG